MHFGLLLFNGRLKGFLCSSTPGASPRTPARGRVPYLGMKGFALWFASV
jgi:hypothetical protein